jgi:RHS repeat-associated protein
VLRKGEVRYNWGSTPTDYTYTGQYSNVPEFGLYYYNARWYDPQLGRFARADTIIPAQSQGTQAWDRYAGMNNNPVRYTDPSGHWVNVAIGAGIGLVAGVALYTLNVARTNNGSLDKWNLGEAALVGATGFVAGALIGTGVGTTAGVAALTNAVTLAPGAAAMVSTTVASAGVGIAAGGGGYLASNIVFGNEFDGSDFAIASAIGGATGALGPTYATTNRAATLLGAGANMTQYTLSQIANGESVTPDGLMFSVATGAVGGRIGGGYYNPKNGIYSIDYYDIHPGELPSELAWQTLSGGARVFAGSTATYLPAKKWVTQLIPQ